MNKTQMILSGVGGQGILAVGSILAETAIKEENLYATMTTSYGVETRGTFTKADVIISEREIYYPEVMDADVILAIAQVAYDKYVTNASENTILIYDSSIIEKEKDSKAKQFGFKFTEIAINEGNIMSTNFIAIGTLIKLTGILPVESVIKTIKALYTHNENLCEMNVNAFNKGLDLA